MSYTSCEDGRTGRTSRHDRPKRLYGTPRLLLSRAVAQWIGMRRTFDDWLRRSGGRHPPLPASGVPRPALRSIAGAEACLGWRWDAEADPGGWSSSKPWWSRFEDIETLLPGCDDRAGVGSCGRLFRFRAGGQQKRVSKNGALSAWECRKCDGLSDTHPRRHS